MSPRNTRRKGKKHKVRPPGSGKARRAAELFSIALTHHRAGDTAQSERGFRQVLQTQPDHAGALHHLGLMAHQAGDTRQAIRLLGRAVSSDPGDAVGWNNLGNLLREQGRLAEALNAYRSALRQRADYATALYNVGSTLQSLGDAPGALDAFSKLLELTPEDADAWNKLGGAHLDAGDPGAAMDAHQQALFLDRNNADAYNGLGLACMDRGEFTAAAQNYRKAIELAPNFSKAYLNLAKSRRFEACDDEDIERMLSALDGQALSDRDRVDLHFAMGKALDDCGVFAEAFIHYEQANRLKRSELSGDRTGFCAWIDSAIAVFGRAFFESRERYGVPSQRPVFIVGMPRSGTTLVEQIIASHPSVHGAGELSKINEIARNLSTYLNTTTPYPACVQKLQAANTEELARDYLRCVEPLAPNASRITDKMPRNYLQCGLIALLFPRARIIECRRDPMDVSLSIYFHQFEAPHPFAYDLADIAFEYRQYQRLMAHWHEILPSRVHTVSYEALISDPEPVSRTIIEHCGLSWDDRCLRFYESQRPVHTASNWQVRQPIYARAVGRWKNYEGFLSDLAHELGDTEAGE